MDNIKRTLLGKPEEEPTLMDEINNTCSLSLKHRAIGFAICAGIGLILMIFSVFFIVSILTSPASFAVPYTLGNIFSLGSTMFLIGPMRQLKNMFQPHRLIATLIYLFAMGLTLFAAFKLHSAILVLFAVILQFGALFWYTLSYIPYARTLMMNCCSTLISV